MGAYLQILSLWDRTANALVEQRFLWSTTWGILVDEPAEGSVSGFGDLGGTLTANLLGALSIRPLDLQVHRADSHPILGTSVKVIATFDKCELTQDLLLSS